ncbi:MAG: TraB/GumN family protein [Thermomonas haemolytica]
MTAALRMRAATYVLAGVAFACGPGSALAQDAVQQAPRPSLSSPAQMQADAAQEVQAPPSPLPVALPVARERGVLFKVTPPSAAPLPAEMADRTELTAPAPSYLLGTIHFGTPQEQGIDYAALAPLLEGAEAFANEVDVDSPWRPDYDGYRWLPVETPLELLIGKDALALAQALLPAVPRQDLQRMKPWAVLALLEARGENAGEASMDVRLQRMAAAAGKRMLHLETLQEQLQALDCVPAAEHAQVLAERLRKSWVLRIESAEAMAFYRSRNLDAWLASIDRMEGLDAPARAVEQRARLCLLEERNARWIGPLETLFQDGGGFVAVGAVHLVGPEGLIARLRRDGYTVEAVPL